MTMLPFVKYHGLGNDFILIDNRGAAQPILSMEQVIAVCDRRFGIGADGVIFLLTHPEQTGEMIIINRDGSEAQMCGNGVRCLADFMKKLDIAARDGFYPLHTKAGLIIASQPQAGQVQVDMGRPRWLAQEIPTTITTGHVLNEPFSLGDFACPISCISMGNPHAIFFVEQWPEMWQELGAKIEHDGRFPERTNVHFVKIEDERTLHIKVWERGAGATLACGTGACAVLVAAILTGRAKSPAQVWLPGGVLTISWTGDTVLMTGPATEVFCGELVMS